MPLAVSQKCSALLKHTHTQPNKIYTHQHGGLWSRARITNNTHTNKDKSPALSSYFKVAHTKDKDVREREREREGQPSRLLVFFFCFSLFNQPEFMLIRSRQACRQVLHVDQTPTRRSPTCAYLNGHFFYTY